MAALQDVSNLQFRIETLVVRNGRKMGRLRPDQDGYYNGMPIAALGIVTRNNTYYDVQSFSQELMNTAGNFNNKLRNGQLYGEWGHPPLAGLSEQMQMARIVDVRESQHSHHIRSIETGATLENGGKLITASICPTGPYAESLRDNFANPCMNTAFSLRAITDSTIKGGVSFRRMKKMITFDAVGAGGYLEASKGFAATESFHAFDINLVEVDTAIFSQASLESFTDSELNEFFGTKSVALEKKILTVTKTKSGQKLNPLSLRSHYHELIKE